LVAGDHEGLLVIAVLRGGKWRTGEGETGNRYTIVFPAISKSAKRPTHAR
jgi:hypothetical protein